MPTVGKLGTRMQPEDLRAIGLDHRQAPPSWRDRGVEACAPPSHGHGGPTHERERERQGMHQAQRERSQSWERGRRPSPEKCQGSPLWTQAVNIPLPGDATRKRACGPVQ